MTTPRSNFLAGVRDIAPILLGVAPFGLITGAAAVGVGFGGVQAFAMSAIMYAGASQLAAIELINRGAPVVIVVLAALVVNLRFTLYSASIAPHFSHLSNRWRWPLAYLLVDQPYALSIVRFSGDETTTKRWYFLGTAIPVWVTWLGSTAVGVLAGARIPEALQLEFVVPMIFLALLVPALEDWGTTTAGIVSGVVAIVAMGLPFQLGLITASMIGITAGLLAEGWSG